MTAYYFDSSALVKRYAQETGSAWVTGITDPPPTNEMFISMATGAEVVAALTRKSLKNEMSIHASSAAIAAFKRDFKGSYNVVLLTIGTVEEAMTMAEAHGLRGYDAIQLATAVTVRSELAANGVGQLIFVSADSDLNNAAQAEALSVDDPNNHP